MNHATHSSRKAPNSLTQKRTHGERVEALEARIVPARMFAVDDANHLLSFDSSTPGTITLNTSITGLGASEFIVGLDIRPATGQLYALGVTDNGASRTGNIYTINTTTAAATLVGQFSTGLADSNQWGFDFNPVVDRIRIVERSTGQNLRVNPSTGALVLTDTAITGGTVDAVAYDRNEGGTGLTTLYGINFSNDHLVRIGGVDGNPSPNGGVIEDVGDIGPTTSGTLSFDIESITGVARAAFSVGGVRGLYIINLNTAAATLVGTIGNGTIPIQGLTTASSALAVVGTGGNDTLTVTATSANDGSYSLNGGAAVPFTDIASFSFLGGVGDDTFTIINPAATVFGLTNGIIFNGQTHAAAGDRLVVQGGAGAAFNSTFTNGAASGDGTLVTTNGGATQTVTLVGVESASDLTPGTSLTVVFTGGDDVLSVVSGVPANSAVVRETVDSLSGTLDVTFSNKGTVNINTIGGNDTVTHDLSSAVTSLTNINFNVEGGTDTVQIVALASGVSANIQLQNGVPDRAVIGGTFATFNTGTGNINTILGTVNVDDSGGVGELYIDNSSDAQGRNLVQNSSPSIPVFNLAGFSINPTFLPGFFNYTTNIQTFKYAGGSGSDSFTVNALNPTANSEFDGNGGSDTLFYSDSTSVINNTYIIGTSITTNNSSLFSFTDVDVLSFTAGSGSDLIDASASPIGLTILGGSGDDTIRGSAFLDTINGGAGGFDTYIASGAAGDVVVTDDGITSTSLGNDVFTRNGGVPSIERVIITGDAGANKLDAGAFTGVAILAGNGGADTLIGAEVKILAGTATFTDVDGDLVNLKVTKGNLSGDSFDFANDGAGFALRTLDLSGANHKGAAVTLSSKRTAAGGDGFINLGYLKATGNDLTVVKIDGDLGQIDAGDADAKKPGIASLIVHSLGELGLNTQNPNTASAVSNIKGLGVLTVKTNFANATLSVTGKLGAAKIGGDLDNAVIAVTGDLMPTSNALAVGIKSVTVAGTVRQSSILAGYSDKTTAVNANVQIGSVTVRGNWIASNLVAGIQANDTFFGNDNDTRIGAADAIVAKIAKVLIFGQAYGTFGGADHYGIVAENIGAASIGRAKLKFLPAAMENFAFGPTSDFRVREI